MRVRVLGRCGGYPAPGGACAGYLVEAGPARLVMDLGYGVVARLLEHVPPSAISAVVLTHLHPDHVAEVPALQLALEYEQHPPVKGEGQLRTLAPAGACAHLAGFAPLAEEGERLTRFFAFEAIARGRAVEVAGCTLRFAPSRHVVETYAVRIEHGGQALVYTADTAPAAEVEALAAGADVLLAEATFPDRLQGPTSSFAHLTGTTAGQLAARAGAGRLLLTHFFPSTDPDEQVAAARSVYHGPVEAVVEGRTYEV